MARVSAPRRWEAAAIVAILLLALGLRLYRLDAQSLWNDEGTSVALAQRDLVTIARHASYDIHPPLYYFLLHGWVALAGTSEFAVRSLSVVAGVALVAGVWALARRLAAPGAAALAALWAAVAPFQVYYAQETRMYIWVTLFGLLATLAFERLLGGAPEARRTVAPNAPAVVPSAARGLDSRGEATAAGDDGAPSSRASARDLDSHGWPLVVAVAYALTAIATIYSHYLGATVLVAHNLAFVVWWAWRWRGAGPLAPARGRVSGSRGAKSASLAPVRRGWGRGDAWRALGRWALLQGLIALVYVPWLTLSWRSLRYWPAVSADFSVAAMLGDALRALVWGPAAEARREATRVAVAVAALVLPGMALFNTLGAHRRVRPTADAGGGSAGGASPRWFGALVLLLYLATPIALMALVSLGRPMYKTKFVLLVAPPLCVLVAAGVVAVGRWVARLSRRPLAGTVLASLLALGVLAPAAQGLARVYWDPATFRDDYRGIAAHIATKAGPDDAILINAPSQIETLGYYYQGPLPVYPLPRQRPLDIAETLAELEAMAARYERLYAVLWATNESDPERVIEGWLDAHAFKAMDRWFGDVRLAMWSLPRPLERAEVVPAGHVLGGQIRLNGYSVLTPAPAGGEVLQVALHWEALAPIAARYKVFVHLVDAQGTIVTQRDSEPGGGARLTSDWTPGEAVIDLYGLLIPAGTPPGERLLRVGMYYLDGGQRLPVTLEGQKTGDAIDLARVYVRGD